MEVLVLVLILASMGILCIIKLGIYVNTETVQVKKSEPIKQKIEYYAEFEKAKAEYNEKVMALPDKPDTEVESETELTYYVVTTKDGEVYEYKEWEHNKNYFSTVMLINIYSEEQTSYRGYPKQWSN